MRRSGDSAENRSTLIAAGQRGSLQKWQNLLMASPIRRQCPATTTRRLTSAQSWVDICRVLVEQRKSLDTAHITTALCRAVQMSSSAAASEALRKDLQWQGLVEMACSRMSEFEAKDLSSVAWALAQVDPACQPFLQAIAGKLIHKLEELEVPDIALAARSFVKAHAHAEVVMHKLANDLMTTGEVFQPRDLVNAAMAFAHMQGHYIPILDRIATHAVNKAALLSSHDAANLAWALAKSGVKHALFWRTIIQLTGGRLGDFDAPEISTIMWAFAQMEVRDDVLYESVAGQAIGRISNFNAPGLARLMWAFAKLQMRPNLLHAAAAQQAQSLLASFDARALAKLAWAFAKADVEESPPLLRIIADRSLQMLDGFDARDLGVMAWSLARTDVRHVPLLHAIADKATTLLPSFTTEGLANTASAFAAVEIYHERLMLGIKEEAVGRISDFSGQGLVDLKWAFIALGMDFADLREAIAAAPPWRCRLPYEHRLHAGSPQDCFKHVVLVLVLAQLLTDPAPLSYIDTHAGCGIYDLTSREVMEHKRFVDGVLRMAERVGQCDHEVAWPAITYLDVLHKFNMASTSQDAPQTSAQGAGLTFYLGSPALAQRWLRDQDRAMLFETSASVCAELRRCMALLDPGNKISTEVLQDDGHGGLSRALPQLVDSRGLVFIDPPYELTFSDQQNAALLKKLYHCWPQSSALLWYPILNKGRTARMYRRIREMGVGAVLVAEFAVARPTDHAVAKQTYIQSGLLLMRPPAGVETTLRSTMSSLCRLLAPMPWSHTDSAVFWL